MRFVTGERWWNVRIVFCGFFNSSLSILLSLIASRSKERSIVQNKWSSNRCSFCAAVGFIEWLYSNKIRNCWWSGLTAKYFMNCDCTQESPTYSWNCMVKRPCDIFKYRQLTTNNTSNFILISLKGVVSYRSVISKAWRSFALTMICNPLLDLNMKKKLYTIQYFFLTL